MTSARRVKASVTNAVSASTRGPLSVWLMYCKARSLSRSMTWICCVNRASAAATSAAETCPAPRDCTMGSRRHRLRHLRTPGGGTRPPADMQVRQRFTGNFATSESLPGLMGISHGLNQRRSHRKGANDEDHQRVALSHLCRLYGRLPTSDHEASPGSDADPRCDDDTDIHRGATGVPESSRRDRRRRLHERRRVIQR
jgi:hypothetical protein